jgi:hypothetical protein
MIEIEKEHLMKALFMLHRAKNAAKRGGNEKLHADYREVIGPINQALGIPFDAGNKPWDDEPCV